MKGLLIIAILSSMLTSLVAQKDPLMDMAMEHFGRPEAKSVWWLKDLKGYYDQCHEIRMVLATDNQSFKGAYEFVSSGEKFYLDGNYDGEQIVLIETDSLGRTTGILKGDMNDDVFYAEWSDPKNTAQVPVYLSGAGLSPYPCGNLGWAHSYTVKGPDSLKRIAVWKYEDDVELLLFYPNSFMKIKMECLDDLCRNLNQLPGELEDSLHYHADLEKAMLFKVDDQKEMMYQLKPLKSIYFDCKTYMDYDDKFSIVYPISGSEKFNQWVISEWTDKYGSPGQYMRRQQNSFTVSDRVSHEEYGTMKIDFFNDKVVSGLFMVQSSKYASATEVSFTYSFEKEKAIQLGELFLPGSDADSLLTTMISAIKKERTGGDEFERYNADEYKLYTITNEGMVCRTPFSTIYGQDKILVSKDQLRPYLKKNAVSIW